MSYQRERDQFIARMAGEGLPLHVTEALLRAATTLQRYAELACSSEAADRDRVPCPRGDRHGAMTSLARKGFTVCLCDYDHTNPTAPHQTVPRYRVREAQLEQRLAAMIADVNLAICKRENPEDRIMVVAQWAVDHQGDPRGYVLRVIPPSYAERNRGRDQFNRESIGVPSGPTRLRF